MKGLIKLLFLFAIVMLYPSCDKTRIDVCNCEPPPMRLYLYIVDNDLNDFLDPESHVYIGDNMKLFILNENGTKVEIVRNFFRDTYANLPYHKFAYPFPFTSTGGESIVYVLYPDKSEDEIRTFTSYDISRRLEKVWINEVLVFDNDDIYYNPDYYIWSEPTKDYFVPKYGISHVVIKKDFNTEL